MQISDVTLDLLTDHVRRYRRSVSPSKNFSVGNEITTQIRHVLSAMINTFCARDEKLCLQGPKGDTGKRGPIGGPDCTFITFPSSHFLQYLNTLFRGKFPISWVETQILNEKFGVALVSTSTKAF